MFDTANTHSIIKKSRTTSNETEVWQMKTSIGYFRDKKQSSVFSGTLSLFFLFFRDKYGSSGTVGMSGRRPEVLHCLEQGEVRLVMPSSYYYQKRQYCMSGGGQI